MNKRVSFFVVSLIVVALSSIAQDLPVDHAKAGVTVAVPDTWVFQTDVDNKGNWEAYTGILGDGTMLIGANTFPEGEDGMNMKVAFVDPKTGQVQEFWGFCDDSGKAYSGPFNTKRQDGNPARIAGDPRTGKTRYIVGMEATPQYYDGFNTGDRWFQNFDYDAQVAVVQIFDKTADGPKPVTNVFDPIYMPGNMTGAQGGAQMRFGGDVQFLSNGNILVVVEDRSKNVVTGGNGAVGSVFDNDGKLVKGPFNCAGDDASHDSWSNITAFNGGFCVRACNVFTVFDNSGNMLYWFDQSAFSSISETGRGDGVRIGSNINANYVYFAGKDAAGEMVVSRFDAVATKSGDALQGVEEIYANETEYAPGTFDRADIGVDSSGNFCVVYADKNASATNQVNARVFNNKMEAVTPTFFAFVKHDGFTGDLIGYESKAPNITMNDQYILISAEGKTLDEAINDLTPAESNFFVVLGNPFWKDTMVQEWNLF